MGLIAPIMDINNLTEPDGSHNVYFSMLEHFTNLASDLGLTVKNDWMRVFGIPAPRGVRSRSVLATSNFWNYGVSRKNRKAC